LDGREFPIQSLMPGAMREIHDRYMADYFHTPVSRQIGVGRDLRALSLNGREFPVEIALSPIAWRGEECALALITDITERRNAQLALAASEERYELAVAGMSVGLWDWNVLSNEFYCSARFQQIIGLKTVVSDLHFSAFEERIHPDERDIILFAIEMHLTKRVPFDRECRLQGDDGSYLWIHTCGQATWNKEGIATRMVGSIDDISKRKQLEISLQRSNDELNDFAYIASHDLKEPLRGISNYVAFLQEDYSATMQDDANTLLSNIVRLTARMESLISELLEYSRLGRTELAIQETDLHQVAQTIVDLFQGRFEELNVHCEIESTLPVLVCDRVRIAEVFHNLISNAMKYNNKPEKWIKIGVKNVNSRRVFYVRDNGIGIPAALQEKVFKIFKRLHTQEEYGGGTGVGLTIVQKIIQRHGGEIWLESIENVGTSFYFTLGEQHVTQPITNNPFN